MLNYILVFVGGGLGSICRYGIAHTLQYTKMSFPLATFLANGLACIVLGFMLGLQLKEGVPSTQKFLIMTGFCGGFSTFSTFTAETYQLFESGQTGLALANIGLSLVICLICLYCGIKLA